MRSLNTTILALVLFASCSTSSPTRQPQSTDSDDLEYHFTMALQKSQQFRMNQRALWGDLTNPNPKNCESINDYQVVTSTPIEAASGNRMGHENYILVATNSGCAKSHFGMRSYLTLGRRVWESGQPLKYEILKGTLNTEKKRIITKEQVDSHFTVDHE